MRSKIKKNKLIAELNPNLVILRDNKPKCICLKPDEMDIEIYTK